MSNVPTYGDRIKAKYGSTIETLEEKINNAILHDDFRENMGGYDTIVVYIETHDFPTDELQRYLAESYSEGGWSLEFHYNHHDDDDQRNIEIFRA